MHLSLPATDNLTGVDSYRLSSDGINFGDWLPYVTSPTARVSDGDGDKTLFVQFKDGAGNVSEFYSDSITLDTSAGSSFGLSINRGALYATSTAVVLLLPAQAGTAEMQVSNDGGFQDTEWEPYTLYKDWQITSFGSHVIPRTVYARFRDTTGHIAGAVQDDIILDTTAPASEITALRLEEQAQQMVATVERNEHVPIIVRWVGTDNVSGVKWYDIQVRTAGGNWTDWLTQRTDTEAVYQVKRGQIYYFRSRAQDNAGNWEPYPGAE